MLKTMPPIWPEASLLSVGSPKMTVSQVNPSFGTSVMPSPPISSPTTKRRERSPSSLICLLIRRSLKAIIMAATQPLASFAPRP
ncbi:hypothetical protein CH063_16044 [Colletotrichum higginsianum]|uniref:Uncharacterized protein n=1 Tax=Colletotrichum higginsianum (strain IMI 349063) TaxID=759273 RepID=H1W5P4_COLHI|nr:hypothetical protein CH063_16044 [Colletotrichum higginsianum]